MNDYPPQSTPSPSFQGLVNLKVLPLAAVDLYTGGVLAFLLARAIRPLHDRLWQIPLLENFILWMLLPAPVLLIVLLIKRRWWRAAGNILLSVLFLANFGGFLLPKPHTAVACAAGEGCRSLRVLSYNLLADSRVDPQSEVDFLRASDADIIGVQELRPEVAALIDEQVADIYPYRVLHPDGIPGMGLLSRYPIRSEANIQLRSPFSHQRAEIDVGGHTLIVINAHPPRPGLTPSDGYVALNRQDIADLVAMASEESPTILLGDFNATDQSPEYRLLAESPLIDSYRESGWGFGLTFPARVARWDHFPAMVRIDYIWHTPDLRATRSWIGPAIGSDHLPLFAELIWKASP
jgi:vancomycin resistance protein VanJ